MKTIVLFILLSIFFQKGKSPDLKGRVVSCTEKENVFILSVLLNEVDETTSTLLFTDKKEMTELISFVDVNDSLFQVLNSGYIDIIKYSQKGDRMVKRFKLPDPLKPQLTPTLIK